jgi:hypothetical protein
MQCAPIHTVADALARALFFVGDFEIVSAPAGFPWEITACASGKGEHDKSKTDNLSHCHKSPHLSSPYVDTTEHLGRMFDAAEQLRRRAHPVFASSITQSSTTSPVMHKGLRCRPGHAPTMISLLGRCDRQATDAGFAAKCAALGEGRSWSLHDDWRAVPWLAGSRISRFTSPASHSAPQQVLTPISPTLGGVLAAA